VYHQGWKITFNHVRLVYEENVFTGTLTKKLKVTDFDVQELAVDPSYVDGDLSFS